MRRNTSGTFALIQFGFVAALIAGGLFASYKITTHTEEATITVESKERLLQVSTSENGSSTSSYKNFVYSEDETYVVQDALWLGHFTAGTIYARIKEGVTCRVTLSGYRFGFLSMYQNIIAADCSQPGA